MTTSAREALSKITRNAPSSLESDEIKIQPSLARVNVNGLLDFRIEETSSSSETRLFSFLSPAKTTLASEAAANRARRIGHRAEAMSRIFMRCLDAFLTHHFHLSGRGDDRVTRNCAVERFLLGIRIFLAARIFSFHKLKQKNWNDSGFKCRRQAISNTGLAHSRPQ